MVLTNWVCYVLLNISQLNGDSYEDINTELIINRKRQLRATLNLHLQNRNPHQDGMGVGNAPMKKLKQPMEVFYKKGVLKNLPQFTRKRVVLECLSLFFDKVAESLTQVFSCGFLRTPFLQITSGRLILTEFNNRG